MHQRITMHRRSISPAIISDCVTNGHITQFLLGAFNYYTFRKTSCQCNFVYVCFVFCFEHEEQQIITHRCRSISSSIYGSFNAANQLTSGQNIHIHRFNYIYKYWLHVCCVLSRDQIVSQNSSIDWFFPFFLQSQFFSQTRCGFVLLFSILKVCFVTFMALVNRFIVQIQKQTYILLHCVYLVGACLHDRFNTFFSYLTKEKQIWWNQQ